nr:hypothetical protein [Streptomyces sulfonofaciens]
MTEASTDAASWPTTWPHEAEQPTGPGKHRGPVSAQSAPSAQGEEAAPRGRHRKPSGSADPAHAA